MDFLKKREIIFFFFILISHQITSLKNKEMCKLVEKECLGKYTHFENTNQKYQVICDFEKCPISNSHRCGNEAICASSRKECDAYLELKRYSDLKSVKKIKSNHQIMLDSKKYIFSKFENTIQNCTKLVYKWSPKHVCIILGNECYRKEKINSSKLSWFNLISKKIHNLKKVECQCSNTHSYHCGKYYCSINKKGLNYFFNVKCYI